MRKFIISSLLALVTLSVSAQTTKPYSSFTPAQKKDIARTLNEELAQYAGTKIDEITTVTSMLFIQGVIQVSNSVDLEYYGNTIQDAKVFINNLAPIQTNTVCTNPSTRNLIDLGLDFKYIYYAQNGVYINEYAIKLRDCN